jgi:ABC-2 type transport system permease protein
MMVIAQFIQYFPLIAGIYFLFERFGHIQGWTMYEVFMCYAVVGMCHAIAECFARGFERFPEMIRVAGFDRVLVRPRGTVLQVLGSAFDIKRIGKFTNAVVVLALAVYGAEIPWDAARIILLITMFIGGSLIFSGLYMLHATAAFWTIEALEITNIFTHGIRNHASYPLNIFPRWITFIFTFIIPFGTINYLPLQYLLGKISGNGWLYALLPLVGGLFIIPCIFAWRYGVSKYSSAGS